MHLSKQNCFDGWASASASAVRQLRGLASSAELLELQ
jgi:hypothetical protein